MLSMFISEHAISPQSVLPQLSAEVFEKCRAGRNYPLSASFQHLCLLLIIFKLFSTLLKTLGRVKKHLADNVLFAKVINPPASFAF